MDKLAADFDWSDAKQLSSLSALLAFAVPSAIGFIGFRVILPLVVEQGVPTLFAWPAIASIMLAALVVVAVQLLKSEAKELGLSLQARFCLHPISKKQWLMYVMLFLLGFMLASGANKLVPYFMEIVGLKVPSYMPFFLDPSINPMEASPEDISPGLSIKGQWILLPLFALALLLNILAEELYFRAWLLPKMAARGHASWVANAVLFALYHTFQIWLLPTILVGSLIWAFVTFHSRSIVPGLVGHLIGNFLLSFIGLCYLIFA